MNLLYGLMEPIRLTHYSHGAGCGCKIAPQVLDSILQSDFNFPEDKKLLVGYHTRDDAAVYDLGNGEALISTTDFFMPIADEPFTFGRIAATNAISDVYAMGGRPVMAIAILGWPIDKLDASMAARVIEGGRQACRDAGILLAGGHSIDNPEPLFGLAVSGLVPLQNLKKNSTARAHSKLYLTKPLGVGILSTAQKKGILLDSHSLIGTDWMCKLNKSGTLLGSLPQVSAMTDVTGFGLLGHLSEMCEGSGMRAEIIFDNVPLITEALFYFEKKTIPGGTFRNFDSYGHKVNPLSDLSKAFLCDPQTSGGLLIAADPNFDLPAALPPDVNAIEIGRILELEPERNIPLIVVV